MDIFTAIEYIAALALGVYIVGAIIAWIYEIKKNSLYREMQSCVKLLDSLQLSAALRHIRMYKIQEDYRRAAGKLESAQQAILENVLFTGSRSSQKEKSFHV